MKRVHHQGSVGHRQGTRPSRRVLIIQVAVVTAVLAVFAQRHGHPVLASPPNTIGVVDFYMVGTTPVISGLDPGRFGADDLAELLPKVAHHPLKVIDRAVLREAAASMQWRRADIANPDRLIDLARRVGAVHLAIGRIERFYTGGRGSGRTGVEATAKIRVQMFDAIHKRFAPGALGDGFATGVVQRVVAQQALHQANVTALPGALSNAALNQ